VSGGRVVTSDGSNTVVCLWGESTRYGGRKNGYHGGLSPQEVTVPLAVMVPLGMNLPGWTPAPPAQPEWWELPPIPKSKEAKPAVAQPVRPAGRKPTAQVGQPQLFEETELPPAPAPAAPDWISALLSGTIYASQRQLAARVALPDEKMRALLTALSERGGKLSRAALAQRLSLPEIRLGGMLSAVRRMLNVDQAPVLVIDEAAGTVELNIALLHQQFRVGGPGRPTMISAARREDIVGALRRGTVPSSGLDALAVGIESFAPTLDEELAAVAPAAAASRPYAASTAPARPSSGVGCRSGRAPAALRPLKSRSTRPRRRCTAWRRSIADWSSIWARQTRPAAPFAA
jgi:hypothetical protein